MENFKLKDDAVPFFDSEFRQRIESIDFWKQNHVSKSALELVNNIFITRGIRTSESCTDMFMWDGTGKFYFTINVLDMKKNDYDLISRDKTLMTKLMSCIQKESTKFIESLITTYGNKY